MRNIIQMSSSKVMTLVVALGVAVSAVVATADVSEAHWVGTGADDNWTTSDNWSPSGSPENKSIVFGAEDRTLANTVNSVVSQDMTVRSLCFTTAEVGALKLGGNLSVTLADGFKTHGGMAWHVVEGRSARTGTFETVDLPEGLRVCYTANGFDIATGGGMVVIVR